MPLAILGWRANREEPRMIRMIPSAWTCSCIVAGLFASGALGQGPKKQPDPAAPEVKALIDQLVNLDRQDSGYSASTTGGSFLPLGHSEFHAGLLFQRPHEQSDAMKTLVKLGPKAAPALLEHLKDDRPTKIRLEHGGFIGGLFVTEDHDKAKKKKGAKDADDFDLLFGKHRQNYTVMVGDLCYVALGQIVNRNYWAVRYQPTAIILVNSIPRSKEVRQGLIKQWRDLTPEKHRDSLLRDLESDNEYVRNGASLRLAYYHPEALESAAIKQLGLPTYSVFTVSDLIRDRLYKAKTAKERKALVDEFVAKNGAVARDGILWSLFEDLDSQEANEQGRLHPPHKEPYKARECLIDLFGLPANVKSTDRPHRVPLAATAQARFAQTLHFGRGEKLDRAMRDILAKTDDDDLAEGCLTRLVGRGYDADIEKYLKRRLPLVPERDRESLLKFQMKVGWTRLHAAVDMGVVEFAQREITDKVVVDAQGRDGRTALHVAAEKGNGAMVAALLAAKANPNVKDGKGRLPAQVAADHDYAEIVRALVAKQSEIPDVFVAATVGAADRLTALVKADGSAVKLRNQDGLTPLHVAAREGHLDAVRALLDGKADPKTVDEPKGQHASSYGWTPLHVAAISDRVPIAKLLLDRGTDVNAADARGKFTALHYAAWNGNAEMTALLLARNAGRDAKDGEQRTPLDLAKKKGHAAVVKLLER
jgi:ankyrin repeat protein